MEQIMAIFSEALTQLQQYISWPYLLAFMLLTSFIKKSFHGFVSKKTKTWKMAYTVFILGIILAIPFYLYSKEGWMKLLVTYAAGTSLYELLFHKLESIIKTKIK